MEESRWYNMENLILFVLIPVLVALLVTGWRGSRFTSMASAMEEIQSSGISVSKLSLAEAYQGTYVLEMTFSEGGTYSSPISPQKDIEIMGKELWIRKDYLREYLLTFYRNRDFPEGTFS